LFLSLGDHQLTSLEQEWLDFQFGSGTSDRFISGFSELDWNSVFDRINELVGFMAEDEREFIAAYIEDFLTQLLSVDGIEFEEDLRLREYLAYLGRLGVKLQNLSPEEEVAAYKDRVRRLYSVHRGTIDHWNWNKLATMLPPPYPIQFSTNRLKASQTERVLKAADITLPETLHRTAALDDETEFRNRMEGFEAWYGKFQDTRNVARAISQGELQAYGDVLQRFGPFASIQELGSSVEFTLHSPKIAESKISVHRKDVIPTHEKRLTKKGKVAAKKMTRATYHELYQDYVCGCVIRVARELFALLPLEYVLITAEAEVEDSEGEAPILSVIIPRTIITTVDFETVDPSDCVVELHHRGDFKASRAKNSFRPVIPLTVVDIPSVDSAELTIDRLGDEVRRKRIEISKQLQAWKGESA